MADKVLTFGDIDPDGTYTDYDDDNQCPSYHLLVIATKSSYDVTANTTVSNSLVTSASFTTKGYPYTILAYNNKGTAGHPYDFLVFVADDLFCIFQISDQNMYYRFQDNRQAYNSGAFVVYHEIMGQTSLNATTKSNVAKYSLGSTTNYTTVDSITSNQYVQVLSTVDNNVDLKLCVGNGLTTSTVEGTYLSTTLNPANIDYTTMPTGGNFYISSNGALPTHVSADFTGINYIQSIALPFKSLDTEYSYTTFDTYMILSVAFKNSVSVAAGHTLLAIFYNDYSIMGFSKTYNSATTISANTIVNFDAIDSTDDDLFLCDTMYDMLDGSNLTKFYPYAGDFCGETEDNTEIGRGGSNWKFLIYNYNTEVDLTPTTADLKYTPTIAGTSTSSISWDATNYNITNGSGNFNLNNISSIISSSNVMYWGMTIYL